MKKAVILAGGLSERMGPHANGTIKCLLPLADETILGRIIRLLKKNNINDIVLVVGYRAKDVKKAFGDSVRYIEEPLYTKEGMLDSLCFALEEFSEPVLFMYADSVFSEDALKKIINSDRGKITCLISEKDVDEESEKVRIENNKIIRCSKEIPNEEACGEFTGIIKMNEKGVEEFRDALHSFKESNLIEHKNVRDLITTMAERNIPINFEQISGEDWMEIDSPEEYEFAKNNFINQIKNPIGYVQKAERGLYSLR